MRERLRIIGMTQDSGVALVAAVGVAIVGVAFSIIVVTQAIGITRDAARDRVRTVEIHAAEAALDSALKAIETSTPCSTAMELGEGSYAVDVVVQIDYYGASGGQLLCSAGVLSDTPVRAELTSVATPTNDAAGGLLPERHMKATVNLVPMEQPSMGVAIFAGGQFNIANNGSISPLDADDPARVWVENANFNCSNSIVINADLIVTDGAINMSNTCRVTGMAWAKTGMSSSGNANPRLGGPLTVYSGQLSANGEKFGDTVSVGGPIWGPITAGGSVCSTNVGSPCPELPLYTKRGMPTVTYEPSDWVGFVPKSRATFAADVIRGANITKANDISSITNNPCALTNGIKDPIHFRDVGHPPTSPMVYDLLSCKPLAVAQNITFVIYADTAFFVNGLAAQNQFSILSGDGEEHNVWFIVPTGYSGGISLVNKSIIVPPIHVFLFTPNTLSFANQQEMVGQAYAKDVSASNSFTFLYSGMGIPGVDLSDTTEGTAPAGFSVEIVSKHEMRNS